MEYLKDFGDPTTYDEQLDFIDYLSLIEGIYGAPNIKNRTLDKLMNIETFICENSNENYKALQDTNSQPSGVRLIFKTDSSELAIKAHLKRSWAHQNIMLFCASGFDIYQIKNGVYYHKTVIAADEPNNIFAHKIVIEPNVPTVIYFPTYNKVINMQIGVNKGCVIESIYDFYKKKPIVFYGNSCTQGASASRSGNAFVNIVSRKMNMDIINYSFSAACRAEPSVAQYLSKLDMSAFVLDYTRNAKTIEEFYQRFEPFFRIIKQNNMNIPVIIIGAFSAEWYDKHIRGVFEKLKKEFNNIFYIDLNVLFKDIDYNYLTADGIHYTDVGMYRVADKIVEYLKQTI